MELLLTLYALVVLQLSPEAIPGAFKQLKSKGNQPFFDKVPGLKETVESFLRGEEDFTQMIEGFRTFIRSYEKSPTARPSAVALMKSFLSYMLTGNEGAFKRIEQASASPVFPPWIGQNFHSKQIDQSPINKKLKSLMKLMTGGNSTGFDSLEEAAEAKVKFPEIYAQWQKLRKEFKASWQAAMASFVKDSGKKTVPYKSLMKFFAKEGIEHTMPTGFEGNIDAAGKWYSQYDELLTGVPSTAVFPSVKMNPNYEKGSTEFVCVCIRKAGGMGNYIYTEATKKSNSVQKFQKVEDFSHIVKAVRSKWTKLIMSGDQKAIPTVAATILELLYEFSARIGSRPTEHNGISSLLVSNYTETPNGFILKYLGKDKVPTKHVFVADTPLNKKINDIVKLLAKHPGKTKKDFLFTYDLKSGAPKLIQAAIVTRTFRQCGAGGLSVHKLRTYHATELMKKELEKIYSRRTSFKNTAEAFGILKKLAMKVGKDLNHVRRNALGVTTVTPTTALANYIDVALQVSFFQHYALPVPKYLEKYIDSPDAILSRTRIVAEDKTHPGESVDEPPHSPERKEQGEEDKANKEESEREEELSEEEKEKLNVRLERDAARIGEMLTKGGNSSGNYSPDAGNFDNVLI